MLLNAGMDPCHEDVMKANSLMLHKCVEDDDVVLLQQLLLYSFPIEHKDTFGRTPLNCIESLTDIKILQLLLNHGAFVNTVDDVKETPLFKIVMSNNVQKAELLMSRGARLETQNCFGCTSLDIIFHRGSLQMVKMIVSKGAELCRFRHETFFQVACQRQEERSAVLAYLLNVDKRVAYQRSE